MDKYDKILLASFAWLSVLMTCATLFSFSPSLGNSMEPTLKYDDAVLCLRYFYPQNLTGKIITFKFNSTIEACHRVIADNGTAVLTKGDANPIPDGWYSKDKITGWVIWYGNYHVGLLCFIILPVAASLLICVLLLFLSFKDENDFNSIFHSHLINRVLNG
jgi:signal peptidase I